MNCENCNNKHNGTYGSGRFCSSVCARGFSTKYKRNEINEKVSLTVRNKIANDVSNKIKKAREIRKCPECGTDFIIRKDFTRKYCKDHQRIVYTTPEFREKLSRSQINIIRDEKFRIFGNSIKCNFTFGEKHICCDSKLEYVGLLHLCDVYAVSSIERCNFYIEYIDFQGEPRRYVPDFKISVGNEIFIIECKYEKKLTYDVNTKWEAYVKNQEIKKEALKNYCDDHGFSMLWFTNKTGGCYRKFKF